MVWYSHEGSDTARVPTVVSEQPWLCEYRVVFVRGCPIHNYFHYDFEYFHYFFVYHSLSGWALFASDHTSYHFVHYCIPALFTVRSVTPPPPKKVRYSHAINRNHPGHR